MNHDDPAPRGPHPFFHTMVVMGSALALGCGGLSDSKPSEDDASGAGTAGTTGGTGGTRNTTGGTGGTASGTGGTAAGTGGSSVGGTATGGSGGSQIIVGTGGTGNVLVTPGPFPCAPETWTCKSDPFCAGRDYYLPKDCTCDEARPASAAACPPAQTFVCRQAQYAESGQRFTEPVPFSCACLPSNESCNAVCDDAFGYQGQGTCLSATTGNGTQSVLCGCAQIVLR